MGERGVSDVDPGGHGRSERVEGFAAVVGHDDALVEGVGGGVEGFGGSDVVEGGLGEGVC